MNVIVASTQWPYMSGGSEVLAAALVENLKAHGHRAELILLPFFPRPISHVAASIQLARTMEIGETNFGAIDRLITLKFPAYLIDHPRKTLWLVHQYRQMYELWDEPGIGFASLPLAESLRAAVCSADRLYLPHHRLRFAISNTVAARLQKWCGLDAETLYPPLPNAAAYFCDDAEDYLLCPGRLSPLKRQDLVLLALALTKTPVRVRFVGGSDDEASRDRFMRLARELGVAERAEYLGWIPESDVRSLYARSIGVVFPPRLEDLGLVTQEAMLSIPSMSLKSFSRRVARLLRRKEAGERAQQIDRVGIHGAGCGGPSSCAPAQSRDRPARPRRCPHRSTRRSRPATRCSRPTWFHVFSCYTDFRGLKAEHYPEPVPDTAQASQARGRRPRYLRVGAHG
jgi:glycosyltransferase involved in cell wall biosynthesis